MSNIRFVFCLRFAVFGILAALLCSCSPAAKKAKLLGKADAYFKAGDYDKAEIEYKNAIQIGGLDPHAIGQLGIIYFDQGRIVRTSSFLFKAVELQPDNLEVRLKMGYFHLATGKPNEARDAAIFILEKNPKHPVAPILLAESTAQVKDVTEARARLQKLPASAPVVAALGLLDLRVRKLNEAEVQLEQARQLDPKLASAISSLGQIYWARKDLERADKAFASAADLSPPRSPLRLQYVHFNLQNGKGDVAKRLLDEMIRATPDFLPSYILRADLAATEKKNDESIALLEKVLSREPLHPEALLLTARVRLAQGEKDKALATLEKAATAFPKSPQVHLQLGNVYLAKGDLDNATASLSEAVKLAPGLPAAVLGLAQVSIRQRNFAPAIVSLKGFLKQNPAHAEAQLLLADAYRNQGNLDDALTIYRQLGESSPRNAQYHFAIGMILVQQNKKDEARRAFIKATELSPDFLPAVEQLVNLDLADKQYGNARARLEAQITANPKNTRPLLTLAKVHLMQGDNEKAEAILQKAIELEPESPVGYLVLAQLYLNSKQFDKALPNLQAVATKNPSDFGSRLLIGVLQQQKGNFSAARESYEKVLTLNPKAPAAINNLAYLLSEHFGELDKAQELAQRARDMMPNQSESADTLGWILYKKRQYPRAVALLEDSAEKLSDNAEAQFHLGMAYYMMGQEDTARPILERALQLSNGFAGNEQARECLSIIALDVTKSPAAARAALDKALASRKDDPVALARLATIYEREGNVEKALGTYEIALKANSSNVSAAVNVIRLYRSRNETAKALDLAKATRKLAPADGRLAHVLGRLAYESGDRQWSVGVLQEAARRQSGDPEVLFDLAEASYSVGQIAAAETALREALEASPAFSRASQSRQYLEMFEIAENPAQSPTAFKSIELALKSDASNVPALMAKGALYEQNGNVKSAKQEYEKALVRFPDFTPAKRRLAILYSAHPEDDKKALELVTKAREAFPNDPDVAKAFGIILFRQGNPTRAASLLQESARSRTEDGEVMYYLGMSQRQLKDQSGSTRSLSRALELNLPEGLAAEARRALAANK